MFNSFRKEIALFYSWSGAVALFFYKKRSGAPFSCKERKRERRFFLPGVHPSLCAGISGLFLCGYASCYFLQFQWRWYQGKYLCLLYSLRYEICVVSCLLVAVVIVWTAIVCVPNVVLSFLIVMHVVLSVVWLIVAHFFV